MSPPPPTDPFTILEPENPSIYEIVLLGTVDFAALKLRKMSVGLQKRSRQSFQLQEKKCFLTEDFPSFGA